MNIGEKIFILRKERQLTQDALAEKLHVSPQAISKWERGITNPDLELIPKLSDFFGITTDELLGIESKKEKLNTILRFDFSSMSENERKDWEIDGAQLLNSNNRFLIQSVPVERIVSRKYDPMIVVSHLDIDLKEIEKVKVKLKTICVNEQDYLQIFYATKDNPKFDEKKSVKAGYPKGNMIEFDVPISSSLFSGILTMLRLDPATCEGECTIESISLVTKTGNIQKTFDFCDKEFLNDEDLCIVNAKKITCEKGLAIKFVPQAISQRITDPYIKNDSISLDIEKANYVHVKLIFYFSSGFSSHNIIDSRIYFKTEKNNVYDENKRVSVRHRYGSGTLDLYFDMTQNTEWKGTLTGLRFDPTESFEGKFDIELIEIIEGKMDLQQFSVKKSKSFAEFYEELIDRIEHLEDAINDINVDDIDDFDFRIDELEEKIERLSSLIEEKQ